MPGSIDVEKFVEMFAAQQKQQNEFMAAQFNAQTQALSEELSRLRDVVTKQVEISTSNSLRLETLERKNRSDEEADESRVRDKRINTFVIIAAIISAMLGGWAQAYFVSHVPQSTAIQIPKDNH